MGAAVGGVVTGLLIRATGTYWYLNLGVQALFLVPLGVVAGRFDLHHTPLWLPIACFFSTGLAYAGK